MTQQFHSQIDISKRIENWCSNKYMYMHVYSSTIHNSQKIEAAQLSIRGWVDKQIVVYTYNEYYAALKQ